MWEVSILNGLTRSRSLPASVFLNPQDPMWLVSGMVVGGCRGSCTMRQALCVQSSLFKVSLFSDQRASQRLTEPGQAELGRRAEYGPVEGWTEEMLSGNSVIGSWMSLT